MDTDGKKNEVKILPAKHLACPAGLMNEVTNAVIAATEIKRGMTGNEKVRYAVDYVAHGDAIHLVMLQIENDIIERYVQTLNVRAVASEYGLRVKTVTKMIRSRRLNSYVMYRVKQKAAAAGVTVEKILAKLNAAIDGTEMMTEMQLAAIGHAARILKPAVASFTVNTQNNFVGSGKSDVASPYGKLTRQELLEKMRDAVADAPIDAVIA